MRPLSAAATLVSVGLALASCGDDGTAADEAGGEVVVFAAASLMEAFEDVGTAFEAEHPDVSVTFSFAGSSALAEQIAQGAPADVFASANEEIMMRANDAGHVDQPVALATNSLAIAVERGNPLGIQTLDDLADPDLVVVLCTPEVPCGSFAAEMLERADVEVTASSEETDVKAVATKIALGEADAGIVYRTDIAAADDVDGVEIPDDQNVEAHYPLAIVDDAGNPRGADAFITFVQSTEGQEILADYGFGPP